MNGTPEAQTVVAWFPTEYWKAALLGSKTATPETQQRLFAVVDTYTIILVVKLNKGPVGPKTFTPLDDLAKDAKLVNASGESFAPIAEDKLTPEAKAMFQNVGPGLAKMLGPLGEGMHLMAFPATGKAGKRLADPTVPGKLSFTMSGHTFAWHLPLGTLLPPKKCEKCGETFKGDFLFCPYDGTPLK